MNCPLGRIVEDSTLPVRVQVICVLSSLSIQERVKRLHEIGSHSCSVIPRTASPLLIGRCRWAQRACHELRLRIDSP
jgi:hypothetical protein